MVPDVSRFLVCALVALLAACGGSPPHPPNVVLVVIDTLRADKLGTYGNERGLTPFLDALAARGTVFEHAYAASSWTVPSMASLFTSRYPTQHRVVTFAQRIGDDEVTIGERLHQAGWLAGGYAANPNLQGRFGYAQGFADWHADAPQDGEVDGDTLRAQALAWLDRAAPWRQGTPVLLYVHYMEPHAPYEPREPFRSRFAVDDAGHVLDPAAAVSQMIARATGGATQIDPDRRVDLGAAAANLLLAGTPLTRAHALPLERLYDAEVASADDQVRQLFDELDRRGVLDGALVVVTADHGEEFFEHGRGSHGITLYEESVRVPLIVVGPGVPAGRRVSQNVSLVDVAPTLLALLGLEAEPRFEGRSLVPTLAGAIPGRGAGPDIVLQLERSVPENLDHRAHVRGLVRAGEKLLVDRHDAGELYDLDADPGETRRDPPALSAEGAPLAAALARHEESLATRAVASAAIEPLDERLKQQLHALGYLH
jgi:arylsulfatase A-like enzyme